MPVAFFQAKDEQSEAGTACGGGVESTALHSLTVTIDPSVSSASSADSLRFAHLFRNVRRPHPLCQWHNCPICHAEPAEASFPSTWTTGGQGPKGLASRRKPVPYGVQLKLTALLHSGNDAVDGGGTGIVLLRERLHRLELLNGRQRSVELDPRSGGAKSLLNSLYRFVV